MPTLYIKEVLLSALASAKVALYRSLSGSPAKQDSRLECAVVRQNLTFRSARFVRRDLLRFGVKQFHRVVAN
jgi:hypothetical protein